MLEQIVNTLTRFGRDGDERRFTAKFLGNHFLDHQLVFHALGVGVWLVDLVDGHHDRNPGRFGVLDGFLGLGHDAVIGRHHQNHNVSCFGTTRTHGGKCLVSRRIQEGDHAARRFDVVGANMLGNTTGFARGDFGAADVVQKRGLAVVHVAHDGHHGGTWE